MPVYILKRDMPYDELLQWQIYFEERPIEWRDDSRFMRILNSLGVKAKPEAVFESLAKMKRANDERDANETNSERLAKSLKGSVLFSKIANAKGGDTPAFLSSM